MIIWHQGTKLFNSRLYLIFSRERFPVTVKSKFGGIANFCTDATCFQFTYSLENLLNIDLTAQSKPKIMFTQRLLNRHVFQNSRGPTRNFENTSLLNYDLVDFGGLKDSI